MLASIFIFSEQNAPLGCLSLEYLDIMNVYVALASQMAIMTKYKS